MVAAPYVWACGHQADTTKLFPSHKINFPLQIEQDTSKYFYEKLKRKLSKTMLTRELYHLIFTTPRKTQPDTMVVEVPKPSYWHEQGKIIGNIYLKKLDIFGPSVDDTSRVAHSRIERFANKAMMKTRDRVICNHLFFAKGDVLIPEKI